MKVKITPKQAEFCNQYLIDLNATQAAIRSGYSQKTARSIGQRLLTNVDVQINITELQRETREKTDITRHEVLSELGAILRAKITDYLNFDGKKITWKSFDQLSEPQIKAVESIKETKDGLLELKLHGKSWTIDRICKILGFDAPKDINVNLERLTDDQLNQVINELTKDLISHE